LRALQDPFAERGEGDSRLGGGFGQDAVRRATRNRIEFERVGNAFGRDAEIDAGDTARADSLESRQRLRPHLARDRRVRRVAFRERVDRRAAGLVLGRPVVPAVADLRRDLDDAKAEFEKRFGVMPVFVEDAERIPLLKFFQSPTFSGACAASAVRELSGTAKEEEILFQ